MERISRASELDGIRGGAYAGTGVAPVYDENGNIIGTCTDPRVRLGF